MSNVAGKAYAMNVVTPIPVRRTWLNALIFQVVRGLPRQLSGLLGLQIIHFARWVLIRRSDWPVVGRRRERLRYDYMLFLSNFNGTWDQYIDAFSDGLPAGLDLLWYGNVKYPQSIPITPFKHYIRANQIDTSYYYNATPGAAQRDIKAALRVKRQLCELAARHPKMAPKDFAEAFRSALLLIQNDLGSQGFAPDASTDTSNADRARQPLIEARQTVLWQEWNDCGGTLAGWRASHPDDV